MTKPNFPKKQNDVPTNLFGQFILRQQQIEVPTNLLLQPMPATTK
jgi:hypothetical protein